MPLKPSKKLLEAKDHLDRALKLFEASKGGDQEDLHFLTVAKAFEVLVEYAWRDFRVRVRDEGLEAVSPKEAVRQGAKLGFLNEPEAWIAMIDARNNSVHDYFGITKDEFVDLAKNLSNLVKTFLKRILHEGNSEFAVSDS